MSYSKYEKTTWASGDKVTSEKLNKIENGIYNNYQNSIYHEINLSQLSSKATNALEKAEKALLKGKVGNINIQINYTPIELYSQGMQYTDYLFLTNGTASVNDVIGQLLYIEVYNTDKDTIYSGTVVPFIKNDSSNPPMNPQYVILPYFGTVYFCDNGTGRFGIYLTKINNEDYDDSWLPSTIIRVYLLDLWNTD